MNDDYPRVMVEACSNRSCACHENTEWGVGGVKCSNDCSYQEPYGFVPEEGCKIHDK